MTGVVVVGVVLPVPLRHVLLEDLCGDVALIMDAVKCRVWLLRVCEMVELCDSSCIILLAKPPACLHRNVPTGVAKIPSGEMPLDQ